MPPIQQQRVLFEFNEANYAADAFCCPNIYSCDAILKRNYLLCSEGEGVGAVAFEA